MVEGWERARLGREARIRCLTGRGRVSRSAFRFRTCRHRPGAPSLSEASGKSSGTFSRKSVRMCIEVRATAGRSGPRGSRARSARPRRRPPTGWRWRSGGGWSSAARRCGRRRGRSAPPPAAVTRPSRFLSLSHSKSALYGAFARERRALHSQKRWVPARAESARLRGAEGGLLAAGGRGRRPDLRGVRRADGGGRGTRAGLGHNHCPRCAIARPL